MKLVEFIDYSLSHDFKELFNLIFSNKWTDNLKNEFDEHIRVTYLENKFQIDISNKVLETGESYMINLSTNDKAKVKRELKRFFVRKYKNDLPWGILIGVRPIKIVHRFIDRGLSDDEIVQILEEEYLIKKSRAELAIKIARKNRKYLIKNQGKYSIYLSIPFCLTRCAYCSFPSLKINSISSKILNKYMENLIWELEKTREILGEENINTIYIGGGTPSSIDKEHMKNLLKNINCFFPNVEELTVEAGRPDTLDEEYLKIFKDFDVDRISINPQSFKQSSLDLIGRRHSVEDIVKKYQLARNLGFKSINMDIILGLPNEDYLDMIKTIDKIVDLAPDNITVHSLAKKTKSNYNEIEDKIIEGDAPYMAMDYLLEKMNREKYEAYYLYRQKNMVSNLENIGFAKEGKECIYNISIIEERESIIGLGLGSVSKIYNEEKDSIKRMVNHKKLYEYINKREETSINKIGGNYDRTLLC